MSALSILVLATALAQPAPVVSHVTPHADPEKVVVDFGTDGVSIDQMLESWSKALGRPFSYHESHFRGRGRVMLTSKVVVEKRLLDSFFQSLLAHQGFALTAVGPQEIGLRAVEPMDSSRVLKQQARFVSADDLADYKDKNGTVVMTSISLKHIHVSNVRGAVTQLLTNRSVEFAQEVVTANALIVVGLGPTVYSLAQVLRHMDQPTPDLPTSPGQRGGRGGRGK